MGGIPKLPPGLFEMPVGESKPVPMSLDVGVVEDGGLSLIDLGGPSLTGSRFPLDTVGLSSLFSPPVPEYDVLVGVL